MEEIKPWIAILIGLAITGYMTYLYLKDRRIDQWPKEKGKVLCSEVAEEVDWDNGRRTTMYSPFVKYEYEVEGTLYKAENIGLVESSCSIKSFAENKIWKYRKGKSVPVFYNPTSIEESYLEKDVGILTYLLLIAGSVGCFVYAYKSLLPNDV